MTEFYYQLKKYFVASHIHNEETPHGHNFLCIATFQYEKPQIIQELFEKAIGKLHYKLLNEIDFFKKRTPSTENIAIFIFNQLNKDLKVKSVEVFETNNFSGGVKEC